MHKLSVKEFERYKALNAIASQYRLIITQKDMEARRSGHLSMKDKVKFPDDVAALANELAQQLWEKTIGPQPILNIGSNYDRPQTEVDRQKERLFIDKTLKSLVPPEREPQSIDHDLIESILIELKAELIRR